MLNMHVRKGDNGWNGIFIPGDSALFGADNLESMARYLETDTEQFHGLNYWRIFESIIPPAGAAASSRASAERGS